MAKQLSKLSKLSKLEQLEQALLQSKGETLILIAVIEKLKALYNFTDSDIQDIVSDLTQQDFLSTLLEHIPTNIKTMDITSLHPPTLKPTVQKITKPQNSKAGRKEKKSHTTWRINTP